MMYDAFRGKKPIVEYEVDSKKIYTYPANEYINTLTTITRNTTKTQYEEACNNNQFIFDTPVLRIKSRFCSYEIDAKRLEPEEFEQIKKSLARQNYDGRFEVIFT